LRPLGYGERIKSFSGFSHAEQIYGQEVEEEPLPAAWLGKLADVGGSLLGVGNVQGLAAQHFPK
jgi:hypothetical protein